MHHPNWNKSSTEYLIQKYFDKTIKNVNNAQPLGVGSTYIKTAWTDFTQIHLLEILDQ